MGFKSDIGELCGLSELEVSIPWIFGNLRAGKLQGRTTIGVGESVASVVTLPALR